MGTMLTVTIPLVLIGYGVWLAVRMIRRKGRGSACAGGCAGCPYADGCRAAKAPETKGDKRHG